MKKFITVALPADCRPRLRFLAGCHDISMGDMIAELVGNHECVLEHQHDNIDVDDVKQP